MTPDPQEVLKLAAQIVETKSLLAELNSKWEMMFSQNGASRVPRAKRDNTFPAQLKAILASDPGKQFTISEVAETTKVDSLKVGRTLFRLANTGRIENPKRGFYQAKRTEVVAQ
jgi:hypothetical protein